MKLRLLAGVLLLALAPLARAYVFLGGYEEAPTVAAALARPAGADWVIVPRVNRASPWVTDLQAHVVRVSDTTLVNNRIVEMKGIELDSALAARLAERGAAWMATRCH